MIRLFALAAFLTTPVTAEVVQSSPAGFEIRNSVTVAVPPDKAWPVVTAPRLWWDKDHTYSDNSANLTLDERAGGCFCEKLPNKGAVEHMRVVYIQPPLMIRMVGALGPLQAEAADGTMAITLTKEGSVTRIDMTYVAGGYIRAGADKLAPVVDRVLGQQLAGLKAALDGLAPAAAAKPVAAPNPPTEPSAEDMAVISDPPSKAKPVTVKPIDRDSPR